MATNEGDDEPENKPEQGGREEGEEPQQKGENRPRTAGERLAARKAAKSARKAVDRGREAEVRETEAVKTFSAAGEWMRTHQRLLWGALALVVLLAVGVTAWAIERQEQHRKAAKELWDGVQAANAPVQSGDEAVTSESGETYASLAARGKTASKRLSEVLDKHGDSAPANWARLSKAAALLEADKPAEARKAAEQALEMAGDDPIVAWRARETLGFAYEAEEKWADAAKQFEKLRDLGDGQYEAVGKYHLARVQMAQGNTDEAQKTLEELLDQLDKEDSPQRPYTRERSNARLASIDPSSARSGGAMQGGGGLRGGGGLKGLKGGGGKALKGLKGGKGAPSKEKLRKMIERLKKQKAKQGGGAGKAPGGKPARAPGTADLKGGAAEGSEGSEQGGGGGSKAPGPQGNEQGQQATPKQGSGSAAEGGGEPAGANSEPSRAGERAGGAGETGGGASAGDETP